MTLEEQEKLIEAARALIKHIAENYGPHTSVLVTNMSVELLTAESYVQVEDYIDD